MAIQIQQSAEILTGSRALTSLDRAGSDASEASPRIFAKSGVYYRLLREIRIYAQHTTAGRSFLISGYRGAGKTMLVANTIRDVAEQLAREGIDSRPLYVRLHGPDLLPSEKRKAAASAEVTPLAQQVDGLSKSPQVADPASSGDDSEIVLKQVAIALYQTAAEEFWTGFRERILERPDLRPGDRRDLLELAAQLRVELDGAADLATLRSIWRRAGRLRSGVLFESRIPESAGPTVSPSADQGFLELLALSSAAQAFRVVSGKVVESQVISDEAKRQDKWTMAWSAASKDLTSTLAGLAAGTLAGSAMVKTSAIAAVVIGILSGLAVSVTLGYSGSRSRDRSRKVDISFLPDRSLSSLDRLLPLLVERFLHVGLAPIFVVDELDKIDNPAERIAKLVDQLKHFITERAFFCFLTDRSYIEKLERESLEQAYPRQHTYFSDRLLVHYLPNELREYLSAGSGGLFRVEPEANETLRQAEAHDLEVLPYVLLHRSRMHVFDLRRELAKFTGRDQVFRYKPGTIRTERRYLFDLLIQVGVECLLDQPDLATRRADDPYFEQLAIDALYYPSRSWERGEIHLDMGRDAFRKYLDERISEYHEPDYARPAISKSDVDLLYRSTQSLVGFLVEPHTVFAAIDRLPAQLDREKKSPRFSATVLDALTADELLLRPEQPEQYQWLADISGRRIAPLRRSQVVQRWEVNFRDIAAFQRLLDDVGGAGLGFPQVTGGLSILPSTPPWNTVNEAMQLLRDELAGRPDANPNEVASDGVAQASDTVSRFARMLVRNREALQFAVLIAAVLRRYSAGETLAILRVVSDQLVLGSREASQTAAILRQVWETWRQPDWQPDRGLPLENWLAYLAQIFRLSRSTPATDFDEILAASWQRWMDNRGKVQPHIYDLIAAAQEPPHGPLSVLPYDLDSLTVLQWSDVLVHPHLEGQSFLPDLAGERLGLKKQIRRVLVMLAPANSRMSSWKPEAGSAAVAFVRPDDWSVPGDFASGFEYALIELGGTPAELGAQLAADRATLKGKEQSRSRYVVFDRVRTDPQAGALPPYISSPASFAEAIKKVDDSIPPVAVVTGRNWRKIAMRVAAGVAIVLAAYGGYSRYVRPTWLAASSRAAREQVHSPNLESMLLAIKAVHAGDTGDTEEELRANLAYFPKLIHNDTVDASRQVIFAPDGSAVAAVGEKQYRVLSNNFSKSVGGDGACTSADYSPSGRVLAIGCGDRVVFLDRQNGHSGAVRDADRVQKVALANDDTLVIGDVRGVFIWDLAADKAFAPTARSAPSPEVTALAVAPGRSEFLYGTANGLSLWTFKRGTVPTGVLVQARHIYKAEYAPEKSPFDFGSVSLARVWLWERGGIRNSAVLSPIGGATEVDHLSIGPGGKFVAFSSQNVVTLWEHDSNRGFPLDAKSPVTGLSFHPDGNLLATSTQSGHVLLWDLATKAQVGDLAGHTTVNSIAFSSDGRYLAAGSDGLQIWNVRETDLKRMSGADLVAEACSRLAAAYPNDTSFKQECAAR